MMRRALALIVLALALAAPARAQIYPGYGTPTLLGDGSASAPSFSFASEQGLGWFRPVLNAMEMAVAGAGVIRLQTNGVWVKDQAGTVFFGSGADVKIQRTGTSTVGVQAAGASSTFASLGGTLFLDSTTHGNVGATLQAINTYTLPANALSVNGKTLKVTAFLATANNAAAKTIGVRWCGTFSITGTMTVSIAGGVRLEAYLARTGSNAQNTFTTITEGLTSATLTQAKVFSSANFGAGNGITCTDSGTIAVDLMAQGTSNNDITSGLMIVELLN